MRTRKANRGTRLNEGLSPLVWLSKDQSAHQIAAAGSPSCIFIGSCVNQTQG